MSYVSVDLFKVQYYGAQSLNTKHLRWHMVHFVHSAQFRAELEYTGQKINTSVHTIDKHCTANIALVGIRRSSGACLVVWHSARLSTGFQLSVLTGRTLFLCRVLANSWSLCC